MALHKCELGLPRLALPMKKPQFEYSSLTVVLDHVDLARKEDRYTDHHPDHVLHILPSDLTKGTLDKLLDWIGAFDLNKLSVIAEHGTPSRLKRIIEAVNARLAAECWITVSGFRIDRESWLQLTLRFENVTFHHCTFAESVWRTSRGDQRCNTLCFDYCEGEPVSAMPIGGSAWPSLKWVLVGEGFESEAFHSKAHLPSSYPVQNPSSNELTQQIVSNLWHEGLEELYLNDCKSVEWLINLPPRLSLKTLYLNYCPTTVNVFNWLVQHKKLDHMSLAWMPDVQLPWRRLSELRKLKSLMVEDTNLDDAQLIQIAESAKLKTIDLYYNSKLTAASWKTLLEWPSLVMLSGSMELLQGPIPDDLPLSTNLKEAVAMNTKRGSFDWLKVRYPSVKVFEM
ncbi:hypothetical protein BH11ARM1_BH11ARM1_11980 [soil metagenome]